MCFIRSNDKNVGCYGCCMCTFPLPQPPCSPCSCWYWEKTLCLYATFSLSLSWLAKRERERKKIRKTYLCGDDKKSCSHTHSRTKFPSLLLLAYYQLPRWHNLDERESERGKSFHSIWNMWEKVVCYVKTINELKICESFASAVLWI